MRAKGVLLCMMCVVLQYSIAIYNAFGCIIENARSVPSCHVQYAECCSLTRRGLGLSAP